MIQKHPSPEALETKWTEVEQCVPPGIAVLPVHFKEMYLLSPPLITREQICKLAGGAIRPRTISNADARDAGPKHKAYLNGRVVYPRLEVVLWLYGLYSADAQ